MLLSWSDEAVPSTPTEIASASSILKLLVEQINPNSQTAELFKHSLELLKEMLSVWGQYLTIPTDSILNKIESQGKVKKSGVQISAAVLATGNLPWSNGSYTRFSQGLCKGMLEKEKDIYKPSAEVLGMMLKQLSDKSNSNMERYETFIGEIRIVFQKMYKDDKAKFITCLYMIQKYCSTVCDSNLTNKVCYEIPKLPTDTKKMCFKIFVSAMDAIGDEMLNQELKTLNVLLYLRDTEFRVACLHIINKASGRLTLDELVPYLEDLCALSSYKDQETRAVSYEILMRAYDSKHFFYSS